MSGPAEVTHGGRNSGFAGLTWLAVVRRYTMPRAKTAVASRRRRKEVLKSTSGQYGKRKSCIRTAHDAFWRGGTYAYRDRKRKKGDFRSLWIVRINAAARMNGTTYGKFMSGLKKKGIELNRKILAHMAVHEPAMFTRLVEQVQS